jgi:uncharacterized membrane protein
MKSGTAIIFAVIGFFVGGLAFESVGWITGAVLGYLLGSFVEMKRRMGDLEREISFLKSFKKPSEEELAATVEPTPESASEVSTTPTPIEELAFEEEPIPESAATQEAEPIPRHQPPPSPRTESPIVTAIKQYFAGGNLIVRVGAVVLFFGVGFLLKFAVDRGLIPIELRLSGVALAASLVVGLGWRLRERRAAYALSLQGIGIGVLFMTVFAAFRLYHLLPATLAFALLVALAVVSALMAVLQDSRALAVLGISGGFLAPILASTGQGSHVALFSYYAILNIGVFIVAWFKSWRLLNVLGFLFTFVIGATWGYNYYQPRYFNSTEPFLIIFFLMYVSVSVLASIRQPVKLKGYVDGTLVFGVPVAAFALQANLVKNFEYGLAWSALALGGFYLALTWFLFKKFRETLKLLSEAFLATGTVFATLAIPFGLNARWTAGLWALEGAAILWIGVRQQRGLARFFGMLLQLAAGLAFITAWRKLADAQPFLNANFLGALLISAAGFFTAYYLYRHRDRLSENESNLSAAFCVWTALWWFGGGFSEIQQHVSFNYQPAAALLFITFSTVMSQFFVKPMQWPFLSVIARGQLPAMWLVLAATALQLSHPLAFWGMLIWPLATAAHFWILHRHDQPDAMISTYQQFLHAGGIWFLAILLSWELSYQVNELVQGAGTWGLIMWGLAPAFVVYSLSTFARRFSWPFKKHDGLYFKIALAPVAIFLWLWSWFVNASLPGDPWPLSYLPILNPLDVTLSFVFLRLLMWLRLRMKDKESFWGNNAKIVYGGYFAAIFFWLNAILFRTAHHSLEIPFEFSELLDSVLVQAALSILWSLSGLLAMVIGTRKAQRPVWIAGAALMGIVVIKLFFVDLSNTGTVARIVSFIAVGIVMLVVGYLSPAPPKVKIEERKA